MIEIRVVEKGFLSLIFYHKFVLYDSNEIKMTKKKRNNDELDEFSRGK